ncbi:MAG: OmpH family outer membrane protein [Deltaproteobacteria bacterium]|nr:MAG: OmpH family outer membrane protein [Deltaproteobacteria bacterium]
MKALVIAAFALLLVPAVARDAEAAEPKVGYTNVEALLGYLPESKAMQQQLEVLEKKLLERLQIKERYYQSKLQTYAEMEREQRWPSQEAKAALERELEKLQKELQDGLKAAEETLARRRRELLAPIQAKFQAAVDAVAVEGGYTYILNQAGGNGVPSILYGVESADVTVAILKKLGIRVGAE